MVYLMLQMLSLIGQLIKFFLLISQMLWSICSVKWIVFIFRSCRAWKR